MNQLVYWWKYVQLKWGNPQQRQAAVETMATMDADRAVRPFLELLQRETNDLVRQAAINALGSFGDARALDALIRELDRPDNEARATVVRSLIRIGRLEALGPIAAVLAELDAETRDHATTGLVQLIRSIVGDNELQKHRKEIWNAYNAIWNLGASAVEPLLNAIADSRENDDLASEALLHALNLVKQEGLEHRNNKVALTRLVEAVAHENCKTRRGAAQGLWKLAHPDAVEALLMACRDNDSEVRYYAVSALREIRDLRAVPAFVEALQDADRDVRNAAVESLLSFKDQGATESLLPLLNHTVPVVRETAAVALGKLDPKALPSIDPLIDVLNGDNCILWLDAVAGLDANGTPRAVSALGDILTDERFREVNRVSKSGLDKIDSVDYGVDPRNDASKALARIGGAQAVDALISGYEAGYGIAIVALGKVAESRNDERAIEAVVSAFRGHDEGKRWFAELAMKGLTDPTTFSTDSSSEAMSKEKRLFQPWAKRALDFEPSRSDEVVAQLMERRLQAMRREGHSDAFIRYVGLKEKAGFGGTPQWRQRQELAYGTCRPEVLCARSDKIEEAMQRGLEGQELKHFINRLESEPAAPHVDDEFKLPQSLTGGVYVVLNRNSPVSIEKDGKKAFFCFLERANAEEFAGKFAEAVEINKDIRHYADEAAVRRAIKEMAAKNDRADYLIVRETGETIRFTRPS